MRSSFLKVPISLFYGGGEVCLFPYSICAKNNHQIKGGIYEDQSEIYNNIGDRHDAFVSSQHVVRANTPES